jgi:hypothetical protein
VDATTDSVDDAHADDDDPSRKIRQEEADDIAGEIRAGQRRPGPDPQT